MRNTIVVIKKQFRDTLKNKTVLIQFILFPIMTLIMENAVKVADMPELFFTKIFSMMYIGMAPLTAVAAIISEEKEKNTLRVLMMANVTPWQYLLGVGVYVWTICMGGAAVMATGFAARNILFYLAVMGIGFAISIVLGGCIGILADNQIAATSLVMPAMAILSFGPMLAMFNSTIEKVARFLYTQQLRLLLDNMSFEWGRVESFGIIVTNAAVLVVLFFIAFRRKGLE
ncbi:MAG: ABC transporter permease [Clostridiaceae bacterium]|nr:ABC transporter permease [Clostridiaceae bacterium]